MDTHWTYIYVS